MKFLSGILVFASVVVSSLAVSISNIKRDISAIESHVNVLNQSVSALSSKGATLGQAIAIKSSVDSLGALLDKSVKDMKSAPHFSESDGKEIFGSFKRSAMTMVQASSTLIAKRSAIKALPVPGVMALVQQGLKTLRSSVHAFEDALMTSEPHDIKGQVKHMKPTVDYAFSKAIAAYA